MEEEKKFEEEKLKLENKKKNRLFNQFIIFLLHVNFYFLILTHSTLFMYVKFTSS